MEDTSSRGESTNEPDSSHFKPFPSNVDVFILGAGPTGLTLACDLARRGVNFCIVDMKTDHVKQSRALATHSRTLEIYQDLGIIKEILSAGVRAKGLRFYVNNRHCTDLVFRGLDTSTPYPFSVSVEQYQTESILLKRLESLGHTVHRSVAVWKIDGIDDTDNQSFLNFQLCSCYNQNASFSLNKKLVEADRAFYHAEKKSERNDSSEAKTTDEINSSKSAGETSDEDKDLHEVNDEISDEKEIENLLIESDKLTKELDEDYPIKLQLKQLDEEGLPIADSFHIVGSKFLVGCDGARSLVRKSAGIKFEGLTYPAEYLVADIRVSWGLEYAPEKLHFVLNENGNLFCIPMTEQKWRVVCTRKTPTDLQSIEPLTRYSTPSNLEVSDLICKLVPNSIVQEVYWAAAYAVNCRIASKMKSGNVFLAGDAAHIHPPIYGQGMNLGIQDAYNLGWKLAAVLKGKARYSLLNSYGVERLAIAEQIVALTRNAFNIVSGNDGKTGKFTRCCMAFITPLMAHWDLYVKNFTRMISMLDHQYDSNSDIIGSGNLGYNSIKPGQRAPDALIKTVAIIGSAVSIEEAKYLFEYVHKGHHTLLLFLHILPSGSRIKNLFGCDTSHLAGRWNFRCFEHLARLGRLLSEGIGSKENCPWGGLQVLWIVCEKNSSSDSFNQNDSEGLLREHIPFSLCYHLRNSKIPGKLILANDFVGELVEKYSLKFSSPNDPDGDQKSGLYILIRPDGHVSHSGYAGDMLSKACVVDYALKYFGK